MKQFSAARVPVSVGNHAIVRRIEWLITRLQRQAGCLARIPRTHQIVGIRRKEEIAILRGEDGSCGRREVVCACHADHGEANRMPAELLNETTKLVVYHLSGSCALKVTTKVRLRAVHPALIRAGLILGERLDSRDVVELLLRQRGSRNIRRAS